MTPIEFKKLWMNNSSENWVEFPIDQIEKSSLNEKTKEFLKNWISRRCSSFFRFWML